MSHERSALRRRLGLASMAALALLLVVVVEPASAHALGHPFRLPVPSWLYLAGAAIAVAASFVISGVALRVSPDVPRYPRVAMPGLLTQVASGLLAAIGLLWWYGAMVAGLLVGGETPVPVILFWIFIWAGLPIFAALLGNPWPSLSPFRSTFSLLEWLAGFLGFDRLDLGLGYPAVLARTPAVLLLFAAIWCELVLPTVAEPGVVGVLMLGYTLLTMVGMASFGRVAWLRNAELFEVLLGWFGRVGPLGRRVVRASACVGCTEHCDPARCIDCPECAAAAGPRERRPELRPWIAGLTEVRAAGWSDAAFILLALAGVTYDGIRSTVVWQAFSDWLLPFFYPRLDAYLAVLLISTVGLLSMWLAFAIALTSVAVLTWLRADRPESIGLRRAVGAYAATLLPIASGYMIAHYLTLVIQGGVWLPEVLGDPRATTAPPIDAVPASLVWYLSVAAIVLGHISAIVLAHRIALRDAPSHPVRAGIPLAGLMVGYTVFSLWIIAQPLVIEPGAAAQLLTAAGWRPS